MSLRTENIVSGYGDIDVLQGIDMTAASGLITGIIGPNGSGKSTLLKTIYGFLPPKKGRVLMDGQDITRTPAHKKPFLGISYIPQERSVFPYLTVRENLLLGGWVKRNAKTEVEETVQEVLQKFPNLSRKLGMKAGDLSGGEQKMLEISRALIMKPKVIFADEPSFGLAPNVVEDVYGKLRELNESEKITILLVDQQVRQAIRASHYVYILDGGMIRAEGEAGQFEERMHEIVKEWLEF